MSILQENEKIKKNMGIEILDIWQSDFDDLRCNAILYKNGKQVANIIVSYDETNLRYSIGNKDSVMSEASVREAFKNLIYCDFDVYLKLPKISEASKLLQSIYDDVCCRIPIYIQAVRTRRSTLCCMVYARYGNVDVY